MLALLLTAFSPTVYQLKQGWLPTKHHQHHCWWRLSLLSFSCIFIIFSLLFGESHAVAISWLTARRCDSVLLPRVLLSKCCHCACMETCIKTCARWPNLTSSMTAHCLSRKRRKTQNSQTRASCFHLLPVFMLSYTNYLLQLCGDMSFKELGL